MQVETKRTSWKARTYNRHRKRLRTHEALYGTARCEISTGSRSCIFSVSQFHLQPDLHRNSMTSSGGQTQFTSSNARAALFIAHPGHELLVHGWLELVRPFVFVLTD